MVPNDTMPPMRPMHLAFDAGPTFYTQPTALIRGLNDIHSSPLGQHILSYEPPRGFFIPVFTMFNGSNDPYDHILHYNHAMTLNAGNNRLLCKVFLACLRGPMLTWFHNLSRNSINSFNELWTTFISQYLCSVQ